jgi:hypothetical protein
LHCCVPNNSPTGVRRRSNAHCLIFRLSLDTKDLKQTFHSRFADLGAAGRVYGEKGQS